MITWSAMPSSSAGPETAGPTRRSTTGTTPEASLSALATRPHVWREATPSETSAPELAMRPTIGRPSSTARCTARSMASPSAVPMAPRCVPPSRLNQLTIRPSTSRMEASTAALRCPNTGSATPGAVMCLPLLGRSSVGVDVDPPEDQGGVVAAEAERVRQHRLRSTGRGSPATTSRPMSSPMLLEVGGRRHDAVAQRQRGDPPRPRRRRR